MASPTIKPIEVGGKTRYRFVVDVGEDPRTGRRKQVTRTFDLKRAAQAELAKILNEVNRGTYARPAKITVNQYLDEWLRSATRGKEAATVRNYSDALRPVHEQLGEKQLQKVTTVDVEDLVDWMSTSGRKRGGKVGAGLGTRAVQLTLSRFRSALDSAVHRRLVEFNVAAPVKAPTQAKSTREPWSETEVRSFLASLHNERLQAMMLLSLMGLRPAEVCGLRWADVDLDAGTLKVANTRTLVAIDGPMVRGGEGAEVERGPADPPPTQAGGGSAANIQSPPGRRQARRRPRGVLGHRLRARGRAGIAAAHRLATAPDLQADGGSRGAEGSAV